VLVGGEHYTTQGAVLETRELLHTSLTFVAEAYNTLREAGVPRTQIITIVQLQDYLRTPWLQDGKYPKSMVVAKCARMIAEGGADYDFETVNPATVWAVLRGRRRLSSDDPQAPPRFPKVVPCDPGVVASLHLSVYSHGDSHPATAACAAAVAAAAARSKKHATTSDVSNVVEVAEGMDPLAHEWFAHMPYPAQPEELAAEILSFIATEHATAKNVSRPACFL
jgi:hypothetical protein